GTFTFNADGTYQASVNESASESLTIPLSCLTLNAITTCDQFAMLFTATFQQADGGPSPISATCTTSGSKCNCSINLTLQGLSATGTYSVSGTHLTTMPDGATGTGGGDYCVQGNTLRLFANAMGAAGMPVMGAMMPAAIIVAERQ